MKNYDMNDEIELIDIASLGLTNDTISRHLYN